MKPLPVWAWWDDSPRPAIIERTLASWTHTGGLTAANGFELRLLGPETLQDWLPEEERDHICLSRDFVDVSPALRSDFLRLALLARYGGMWLDVSVLVTEPLQHWIQSALAQGTQFIAMRNRDNEGPSCPGELPFIESSMLIAAAPGLPIIEAWRKVFWTLPQQGLDAASARAWTRSLALPRDVHVHIDLDYHVVYWAWLKALVKAPRGLDSFPGVWLRDGTAEHYMPCPLDTNFRWCRGDLRSASWPGPFMKLASETRSSLRDREHEVPLLRKSVLYGQSKAKGASISGCLLIPLILLVVCVWFWHALRPSL